MFGYKTVEIFNKEFKKVFIKKVNNPNFAIDFFNPSAVALLENQDLIVFKNPAEHDIRFSKNKNLYSRLMGKPGDVVFIKNQNVYINNKLIEENYDIFSLYRLTTEQNIDDFKYFLNDYDVTIKEVIADSKACNFIGTQYQADAISKLDNVINVRKLLGIVNVYEYGIFPISSFFPWNPDNYGPVTIPKKGETVMLNYKNIDLYKDIIDIYEENDLYHDRVKILINGKNVDSYTFRNNYYFILNDNRAEYNDSRKWGFIPEDYIVGKVIE
jgi:signal peptidase I